VTTPIELLAALRGAAGDLTGAVEVVGDDATIAWSRAGAPFAVLAGAAVELRVGPTIAAAAVRTPDAGLSGRGADWISFGPRTLDGPALDRLVAWFAAAFRRAAG
jgi:hypothetical protein